MRPIITALLCCSLLVSPFAAGGQEATLYQRIGGAVVMQRVADATVRRVAADPSVNQSFDGVDLTKVSTRIASHFCAVTGGDCAASSDSMQVVHAGLKINEREFYAVVEALRAALDDAGVGEREKNEFLRMLAPHKRDVVTR